MRPDCDHCGEPVIVERGVVHYIEGRLVWYHRPCHFERMEEKPMSESVNFMSVLPNYSVGGVRAPSPGGTAIFPTESWLTGVQGAEVETVVAILRRMGFDTIHVNRTHPISFVQEVDDGVPDSLYGYSGNDD